MEKEIQWSKTPRVDAHEGAFDYYNAANAAYKFARELEVELNEALEKINKLEDQQNSTFNFTH